MAYGYSKKKIDNNQNDIVDLLRKMGVSVEPDHDDILVGYNGKTYWFEIKSDLALDKNGNVLVSRLRKSQKRLLKEFKGQYDVVNSVDQILNIINYENIK